MTVKSIVTQRLRDGLEPVSLEVIDESQRHAGHGNTRPDGETHFRLKIVSAHFVGRRKLERHRMVYNLLASEIEAGLHAIAMTTLTPEESCNQQN